MMKSKLDLLKTSENRRISPYGKYYISVRKRDMLNCGKGEFIHSGNSFWIHAIFETSSEHFNREYEGIWVHDIPLSVTYNLGQSLYYFDASIYFPSLTTLNIIKGKCFIRLLLGDKEIYDAIANFMDFFNMSDLPGTPPISAFESFLKMQIVDIETKLKMQIGYPIMFEDIEGAENIEVREQALRKFGYENYVREGFEKGKVKEITFNRDYIQRANNTYYYIGTQTAKNPIPKRFNPKYNKDEKIILLTNDICFLQVKDSSTGKTYFLKVPPTMRSVEEAKAWTFGLNPGEYNPEIET